MLKLTKKLGHKVGKWKRRTWSDTDTDTKMHNFKIHFTFIQHLLFKPNVVFTTAFASRP